MAMNLPPMIWGAHYNYVEDAMLLILASGKYNPDDHIRAYDDVP